MYINQGLEFNDVHYELKFATHFVQGGWHFITKYKISNLVHLTIDDNETEARIETNSQLILPRILFFVKK